MKLTKAGLTSLILAVVPIAGLIILQCSMGTDTQAGLIPLPDTLIELTIMIVVFSPFAGLAFGIMAVLQKGTRRWLPVLAVILNSIWIGLVVQQLILQGII